MLCPYCGKPIHDGQVKAEIQAFELTGKDRKEWRWKLSSFTMNLAAKA